MFHCIFISEAQIAFVCIVWVIVHHIWFLESNLGLLSQMYWTTLVQVVKIQQLPTRQC